MEIAARGRSAREQLRHVPLSRATLGIFCCVVFLLIGCVRSNAQQCGDTICPAAATCTESGQCVIAIDATACVNRNDGDACAGSVNAGTCTNGICVGLACGNGTVDSTEVCDDGNRQSGDGCRLDCGKREQCGDNYLDEGETCDDGNHNDTDGCAQCQLAPWRATTLVGALPQRDRGVWPTRVRIAPSGQIYLAEENGTFLRYDDGAFSVVAGGGSPYQSSTAAAAPAVAAYFIGPSDIAIDGRGAMYLVTFRELHYVDTNGFRHTKLVAEDPEGNFTAVTVDSLGNVFLAVSAGFDDTQVRSKVLRITPQGDVSDFAGNLAAQAVGDDGPATEARFRKISALALAVDGSLLVVDELDHRVRRIARNGTITTVAGTGEAEYNEDDTDAVSAALDDPSDIAPDADGGFYLAERWIAQVRYFAPNGSVHVVAGSNDEPAGSGDGGPAINARLSQISGIALTPDGNLYISDYGNYTVRHVSPQGIISTVLQSTFTGSGFEGMPALAAEPGFVSGLFLDEAGRLTWASDDNSTVQTFDTSRIVRTIAGQQTVGYGGDGGPARDAVFNYIHDILRLPSGAYLIADTNNHRIRKVSINGIVTTFAGSGDPDEDVDDTGDGGLAQDATLMPQKLALGPDGSVYVATSNSRVRKIAPNGIITTVAGNGTRGSAGDDGPALNASLSTMSLAIASNGDLYIGELRSIRKVTADGRITRVAGNGEYPRESSSGPALSTPAAAWDMAWGPDGALYFVDGNSLRRLADGQITTLTRGDAPMHNPYTLAVHSDGTIYLGNWGQIWRREPSGRTTLEVGRNGPTGQGPVDNGRLADVRAVVATEQGVFAANGGHGVVERLRDGMIERIAGRSEDATQPGSAYYQNEYGDVTGLAWNAERKQLYVALAGEHRIDVIDAQAPWPQLWTLAPLVNINRVAGHADGPAADANLHGPTGLWFDEAHNELYIADTGNHAIRVLDLTSNQVHTVANHRHRLGYFGDGARASDALLYQPQAITRCPNGDLYIADTGNHRIRRIAAPSPASPGAALADAPISTVLGDGIAAASGEGAPANTFPIAAPRGIVCDGAGNVFATSGTAVRGLAADDSGIVDGRGRVHTLWRRTAQSPAQALQCIAAIAITPRIVVNQAASELVVADTCTGKALMLKR